MRKSIILILVSLILGCATSNINIDQNADPAYTKVAENILVTINSSYPETIYNASIVPVKINFIELLENQLYDDLKSNNLNPHIYRTTGLDLDNNSIKETVETNNIDTILELNHVETKESGGVTISHKYDVSLYLVNENKKIWRAQISIKRAGFGAAGLNKDSVTELSNEIIQNLKTNSFF